MTQTELRASYLRALREGNNALLNCYAANEEEHDRLRQLATNAHMDFVSARVDATRMFRNESTETP